jgi:hypothetical protein
VVTVVEKLILILSMFLLTSCFYLERVIDYDIEGCDSPNLFCTADFPYTQEEVGDSVVPYHRYFVIGIKNASDYGIFLPNHIKKGTSLEFASLVDEQGQKVNLSVMLKSGQEQIRIESSKIFLKPSRISNFHISVTTPSIPSYEIVFRFEKGDGTVHVLNFKMNQEINHKFIIIPFALLAG